MSAVREAIGDAAHAARPYSYESISVKPLSPNIGAEIGDIDLREPLSERQLQDVKNALWQHQVIFFRDQQIDFDQHSRFARYFGTPHTHVGFKMEEKHPEIRKIIGDEKSTIVSGDHWHTDQSCAAVPPMGSILHMHQVPPNGGGDTQFASMYAAYDALSPRMKAHLQGLTATHEARAAYQRYENAPHFSSAALKDYPVAVHPVVAVHPESGRKLLYVNGDFTTRINDIPEEESKALLGYLVEHCRRPEFMVRFHWRKYSIAFWDNRCTQHQAIWDYQPHVRIGYRIQIKGTQGPVAAS